MTLGSKPPESIAPGDRLDRYELLCPIAEGGMASVWLARMEGKHGFEKLVALKTILPKFATDATFERMLLDESRIASRIEHANVAQILDLGEHHELVYLVLEWVDGESLSRLFRAVRRSGLMIPHGVLLRILADTCGGLHAAHELCGSDGQPLGVIHRDVSPQNILISAAGVPKLIDFGIAKARDRLAGETNAGVVKGKVRYMAPEQAMGRPSDRRVDLWAVGAILYRLISGKAPYEGENDLASLNLLTAGQPPEPLPSTVHPSIAAIVNRALSNAPERRFPTAAAMQAAMEAAMLTAGMVTTTAGVAAFAAKHLAAHNERRGEAVKLALEAAADRVRMRELLQPMVHKEVSTDVSEIRSNGLALSAPDSSAPTLVDFDEAEVTHHKGDGPKAPTEPPRPSQNGPLQRPAAGAAPPAVGSPSVGPLPPPRPPPRPSSDPPSRFDPLRGMSLTDLPAFRPPARLGLWAACAVVTFLVVLVGLSLAGRPHPARATARASSATPAAAPSSPAPLPSPAPALSAARAVEPPAAAPAAESVPVIAATDLPRAAEPPPPLAAAPAQAARPRPLPPPVAKPAPPPATEEEPPPPSSGPKPRVNDGF